MNNEFLYCFTMDDIAMADYSTEAHFERTLDFCREQNIKATFFVLPRSGGADLRQKPGYIALCKRAIAEGHELSQHGLDHDRFEAGIPPQMILDLPHEGPTRAYLATHRNELAERHTIPALRAMLAEGRQIMVDAIGVTPVGFRGPSAAICPNLHPAQALEGYLYDSTIMMQSGAWDLLNDKYTGPAPVSRDIFNSAQDHPALQVLSGTGEYTWYLDESKYAVTMELAKYDFHRCLEEGIPFISVAHVSPMFLTGLHGAESEIGAKFYRELLAYCRKVVAGKGMQFTSMTLAQYAIRTAKHYESTVAVAGVK